MLVVEPGAVFESFLLIFAGHFGMGGDVLAGYMYFTNTSTKYLGLRSRFEFQTKLGRLLGEFLVVEELGRGTYTFSLCVVYNFASLW